MIRRLLVSCLLLACPAPFARAADAPPRDLNVVLVTADSVNVRRLSCYGFSKPTTPYLEELCRRGVRFDQAYTSTTWTSPALVSLLTSYYPQVHGVEGRNQNIPPEMDTPVKILRRNGWAVPAISHIHTVMNYQNLGFTPAAEKAPEDWIRAHAREGRFFLWHHFYTPHLPYAPPQAYRDMFFTWPWDSLPRQLQHKLEIIQRDIVIRRGTFTLTPAEMGPVEALYLAKLRWFDDQLRALVAALEETGVRNKTILVVTADHGEELLEHGFIGHASTNLSGTAFDEVLHIPLIWSLPGVLPEGRAEGGMVQTLDVMPTLLELLGLPGVPETDGRSFLAALRDGKPAPRTEVFCQTRPGGYQVSVADDPVRLQAVRTPEWKFIHRADPRDGDTNTLYHLTTDPGEHTDVLAANPQQGTRLETELNGWLSACALKKDRLAALRAGAAHPAAASGPFVQPRVNTPADKAVLRFDAQKGAITIAWEGDPARPYTVEYEIGLGDYHMTGQFPVDGNTRTFGPFPPDLWNQFHLYNPWRFRIVDPAAPDKPSAWSEFTVESPAPAKT